MHRSGDRVIGASGDRKPGAIYRKGRNGRKGKPLRHSGNRDGGNRLAQPAALVKAFLVKPLIPLTRISEIGQKYSQGGGLPCVIFLKVARWWKPSH
jgi:hypothetical protein